MSIISVQRDTNNNLSIVRLTVSDTLATVASSNYILNNQDEINSLNSGPWQWFLTDVILVAASNGNGFFEFTNSTFSTLVSFGGGSGSVTIAGDTGSITGNNLTIYANTIAADNSGSSVEFVNSGTVSTLNLTDSNGNTMLGNNAGVPGSTSANCVALGKFALGQVTTANGDIGIGSESLVSLTSGQSNVAVGTLSGAQLVTGNFNLYIGNLTGVNHTTSESSNIYLNNQGTVAESNVLRIGQGTGPSDQQLLTAFISGINGNTLGGTPLVVTIDPTSDQLGVIAIPTGSGIGTIDGDSGSITGSTVTIYANNASNICGSSISFVNSGTTSTLNVTDGNNNTIFGSGAGNLSISGNTNTIFGQNALVAATSASGNCGFGTGAMGNLQTGFNNTSFGQGVLGGLVSGNGNTVAGLSSGGGIVSGSFNLMLGYQTGVSNSGADSNNVYLNNNGTSGDSNVLRVGGGTGTGMLQLSTTFISGINGNTLPGANLVTIDPTTDQLGVTTMPAAGISTINGDTGSITGSTVTIYANNSGSHAGSTVSFTNSGTTSLFNVSDSNSNTIIGNNAGNGSITGSSNTGLGQDVFLSAGAISSNVAIGFNAGISLGNGAYNSYIGASAGSSNNGGETGNVYINNQGNSGESNTLRIGAGTGSSGPDLATAFISGINGNTVSSAMMVTINSSTDQLGVQAIPSPAGLPWTDEGASFTAVSNNGYYLSGAIPINATLPASPSQGDVISIISNSIMSVSVVANTGQFIRIGTGVSSSGGSATKTAMGDTLQLVYIAAPSTWINLGAPQGSWVLA